MVENSVYSSYRASPARQVALGCSPGVPDPFTEAPPPRWLSVRTGWALCFVFFLSSHLVTLSGILLSLPARGHRCRLLDRKPEAEAKESQRKPNTELANFQPQVQSLPPKNKISLGLLWLVGAKMKLFSLFKSFLPGGGGARL